MKVLLVAGFAAVTIIVVLGAIALWLLSRRSTVASLEGPQASWSIPDSWSVSTGELNGKPLFLRFNSGLKGVIGHPSFGKQLGIAVRFLRPSEDGLPDSQEMKELDAVEEKIRSLFQGGSVHLFAGIITTGSMREFVIYTSDEAAAAEKAKQVIESFPEREIQSIVNDDPEWKVYKQFAGK